MIMKKKSKAKRIVKITALSLAAVILLSVITAGVILYGRIATVMSVKQVGNQLYTVNYQQNYHLNKALAANIKTEKDMFDFICNEFYFGYQIDSNVSEFSCSAFLSDAPDGKKIVGRNFDFSETETLSVYTHPKDGYSSLATVDLDVMAVGKPNGTDALSFEGKLAMLAAPYLSVDGMNEKGLCVSLLDLKEPERHHENGKTAVLILVAVRMLLDRAASVDEAIELLEQYDIHTVDDCAQHMFIADKNEKAVVIEWSKSEMTVTESPVCTNFNLSRAEGKYDGLCNRFDVITHMLADSPENDTKKAFEILKAAQVSWTQWSCVYNLDDFTVDYVIDNDFENSYHLGREDY